MKLWDYLVPDVMCDTVYQVPFERFFEKGVRALVFDIDNTLVSYDTPRAGKELQDFLLSLRERGVPIAFVSNNDEARVSLFNSDFGFAAKSKAGKPSRKALLSVSQALGVSPQEILFVGDQLLTDALCARRSGAQVAIVRPVKRRENLFFRFKRILERPFVALYRHRAGKER